MTNEPTPETPIACPNCGSPEVEANTPRTKYACGSSDYDQRPGTLVKQCAETPTVGQDGGEPRGKLLSHFAWMIGGWNASPGVHPGRLQGEDCYSVDEAISRRLLDLHAKDIEVPLKLEIEKLKAASFDLLRERDELKAKVEDLQLRALHAELERDNLLGGCNSQINELKAEAESLREVFHKVNHHNEDLREETAKLEAEVERLRGLLNFDEPYQKLKAERDRLRVTVNSRTGDMGSLLLDENVSLRAENTELRRIVAAVVDSIGSGKISTECSLEMMSNVPNEVAVVVGELRKDKARLSGLLQMTDREAKDGSWKVTLVYDNYHDGALVVDGDAQVLGECYEMEKAPNDQFRAAIDAALAKHAPEQSSK